MTDQQPLWLCLPVVQSIAKTVAEMVAISTLASPGPGSVSEWFVLPLPDLVEIIFIDVSL